MSCCDCVAVAVCGLAGWRQCALLSSAAAVPLLMRSKPCSSRPRHWLHTRRLLNLHLAAEARDLGAEDEAEQQHVKGQSPLSPATLHQKALSHLKVHSVVLGCVSVLVESERRGGTY